MKRGVSIGNKMIKSTRPSAVQAQQKTLLKLLNKAKATSFGRHYNFSEILNGSDPEEMYRQLVPLCDYDGMHPWWRRAEAGELDVAWPGRVKYFALSSGTSGAPSKHIPITKDQFKAIRRASIRQLVSLPKYNISPAIFSKKVLTLAGSTQLQDFGNHFRGDLSGINTKHLPPYARPFHKPGKKIASAPDWELRLEKMVEAAPKWDLGIVAGVPAWFQILMEKVEERYRLESIHEIWPNLQAYIHGGVAIDPYVKPLNRHFSKPVHFIETYLASEGFIALQDSPESQGMELLANNGIYFEFIPFNEQNFDDDGQPADPYMPTLRLAEIEEGVNYALVMSTCAGAWRYLIGDVVRFVSLDPPELVIDGRTKHFLSLCGEHLSVDNMTHGVVNTGDELGYDFQEFTVSGIALNGEFGHHWFIGCDKDADPVQIQQVLDAKIALLNDDYPVERAHALKHMVVTLVPSVTFNEYLASKGKQGGQVKFPRVIKKGQYEDWMAFLVEKGLMASDFRFPD